MLAMPRSVRLGIAALLKTPFYVLLLTGALLVSERMWRNTEPVSAGEEEALLVKLRLSSSADDVKRIHALEDKLSSAIRQSSAGELDGDYFGNETSIIYMYGPSAERLFAATIQILREFHPPPGSYVVKRFGRQGSKEERVDLSSAPFLFSDRIYRVGGGVSAPRPIYTPDPDYSEEARKSKYQGMVVLWLVIGADGHTHEVRVARRLGMGLDEKAIEAVKQWQFEPAMKDGQPVAVQMNVEVSFRLNQNYNYCCLGDVLSDTMGVDFNPYFASVLPDLGKNWDTLAPQSPKQGGVAIQFAILKDGRVADMHITSPPGNDSLDRAARDSIARSSPFEPLPAEFKGKNIVVRMHFYTAITMIISPQINQQEHDLGGNQFVVVMGSVQQFSVSLGSIKDPAVTWSVSGDGCSGSTCGTISATGLYTAPIVGPMPPFIMVKATLAADPNKTASVLVKIVPPRLQPFQ